MKYIPDSDSCLYIKYVQPKSKNTVPRNRKQKLIKSPKTILPKIFPLATKLPIKDKKNEFIFSLTTSKGSWESARLDCWVRGGDLASITSHREQAAVQKQCQDSDGRFCWIGLKQRNGANRNDEWYWVDGTQDFNYNEWGEGEEFKKHGNHDVAVIDKDRQGKWYKMNGNSEDHRFGVCMILYKLALKNVDNNFHKVATAENFRDISAMKLKHI